jgi:RNA-directed DNA polymerase
MEKPEKKSSKKVEQKQRKLLRNEKQAFQTIQSAKYTKVLETLKNKFTQNINSVADNLMSLLENKYFLFNGYEPLKSNTGSLTKGTDTETADEMAEERIEKLAQSIKDKTFKFRPSRRIYVPKPGKTTKRPITIPNFDDRVLQEATRVILNAIYEPIFQNIQVNLGFRPELSTTDAMENIQTRTSNATTAIEGDIKGAYDNVVQHL